VPKFQILNRWDSTKVLFECEGESRNEVIRKAIASRADLSAADLSAANLSDANLRRADLSAANLSDANLSAADLRRANLSAADLSDANLRRANLGAADLSDADLSAADLSAANLSDANLSDANLSDANLSAADLSDADLRRANLSAADLDPIKADIFLILHENRAEVAGLLNALRTGKIDGSTYHGECACLVGTVANVRGVNPNTLKCNAHRPAERWFLALRPGNTPSNSAVAKITEQWLVEWIAASEAEVLRRASVSICVEPAIAEIDPPSSIGVHEPFPEFIPDHH